jgi:ribonuclease P protein component
VQGSHLTVLVLARQPGPTQIGITTSRKVGKAVLRNRFRRLLRESLRPLVPKMVQGYKIVVVVRPRADADQQVPSLGELRAEVERLLTVAGVLEAA